MRHLMFWFLAGLTTISTVDVGTSSSDGEPEVTSRYRSRSPRRPQDDGGADSVNSSDSGDGSFNRETIQNALNFLNEDVKFDDIFAKILTELKMKNLAADNVNIFIARMFILAEKTIFLPYIDLFGEMVNCFVILRDNPEKNEQTLQGLVQEKFNFLLALNKTKKYVTAEKIAPSLASFILSEGDTGKNIAKEVVRILMTDREVQEEIAGLYSEPNPRIVSAYKIITDAIYSD